MNEFPHAHRTEKRIGKLLTELGFVTESQMEEALEIAKQRNIRIGEALTSMGVLDKDHIYWVLGTQLNMTYVELSPDMIDETFIRQFPPDLLKELGCLPLYEEDKEVHVAIADPTDSEILQKVRSLRPEKVTVLHLALPEKIADILGALQPRPRALPPYEAPLVPSPRIFAAPVTPPIESFWNDLVSILLSAPPGETFWLCKTPRESRLIRQTATTFEPLRHYPHDVHLALRSRLEQASASSNTLSERFLFLSDEPTGKQGAFRASNMPTLDGHITTLERIPTFSNEEFLNSHREIPALIKKIRLLFGKHPRLLVGGDDALLIKQCFYSLFISGEDRSDFPPPCFIERRIEMYFPQVAQVSCDASNILNFLERLESEIIPFLFFESERADEISDVQSLSRMMSCKQKHVVIYFPCSSMKAMRTLLSRHEAWRKTAHKVVFFQNRELKTV